MKLLIVVPVYNRRNVTLLCLAQLQKYSMGADIAVYDDGSTDFAPGELEGLCTHYIRSSETPQGNQLTRWKQFDDVSLLDKYDNIYLTDSDAYHDPDFISRLSELRDRFPQKCICLYRSSFRRDKGMSLDGDVLHSPSVCGISQLHTIDSIRSVSTIPWESRGHTPKDNWEECIHRHLTAGCVTSAISYVEHFGACPGSVNSRPGRWNRDRALNATVFLQGCRAPIIDKLEGRI